ncbi:hypothetical protein [Bacillus mycoides]|uniref:hypothetical protein n=1 Tax=Bacillus mycoides TaxID=1405 RepID=UPI0021120F76|nr:hypothetical protein [Bacillus mycoides]MCQ6527837.1 hypothetical protein [Bacillus mycoides]
MKCIQKGYKILAFISSMCKGGVVYIITYFITKWIVYWIINLQDIRKLSNWDYLVDIFFEQISDGIKVFHIKDFIYSVHFKVWVLILLVLLVGVCLSIHGLFAGKWYRTHWETPFTEEYHDWLSFLKTSLAKLTTNPLLKMQIQNFFGNRLQLSYHYSYFFGHYFNYALIAVAAVVSTLSELENIDTIKFVLIYIIFNVMSKDAYETITLFPGLLRFDSEGKILHLYRMTNTPFTMLYQIKIHFQRLLGTLEMACIVIICLVMIQPNIPEIYFISCVITMNFLLTPHITTLSTFMFPHLKNQHYSEMEDYVETEFVIDKIAYQFRQILFFCSAVPFLLLVFFEIDISWIYILIGTLFIFLSFISLKIINGFIKKAAAKLNQSDL